MVGVKKRKKCNLDDIKCIVFNCMIEKKPTYVTCRNRKDKPADISNKNSKVPSHHHHWTGLFGPEVHPGGCEARSPPLQGNEVPVGQFVPAQRI